MSSIGYILDHSNANYNSNVDIIRIQLIGRNGTDRRYLVTLVYIVASVH